MVMNGQFTLIFVLDGKLVCDIICKMCHYIIINISNNYLLVFLGTRLHYKSNKNFPKPITLIITEKNHKKFKRICNDLIYSIRLSKRQIKSGVDLSVPMLDGSIFTVNTVDLSIPINKKLSRRTFYGKGMPVRMNQSTNKSKSQSQSHDYGDLIIEFHVYP